MKTVIIMLLTAGVAGLQQSMVPGFAAEATATETANSVPTLSKPFSFRVVDADSSAPLPGVTIRVKPDCVARNEMGDLNRTGVTDNEGKAGIEVNTFAARRVEYWTEGQDGYAAIHGELQDFEVRYLQPILIKLQRRLTIGGLVAGPDGKPVEGAEIMFNSSGSFFASSPSVGSQKYETAAGQRLAVTDRDGRWMAWMFPNNVSARTGEAAGNPDGINIPDLELRIRHPDFADAVVSAAIAAPFVSRSHVIQPGTPGEHAGDLDEERLQMAKAHISPSVVLSPGVSAGGKVVDAKGAPLAGVEVWFGQSRRLWERSVVSGADGQFQIQHLPEHAVSYVAIRSNGFAPLVQAFRAEPVAGKALQLGGPLMLEPSPGLTGRVVDLEGHPISGVYIQYAAARPTAESVNPGNFPRFGARGVEASAKLTDENGLFKVDFMTANSWCFQFEKDGYITRREVLSAGDHEIPLAPVLKLSGSVTDAKTGKPVPRFLLSWDFGLECFDNPTHRYSMECTNGTYALDLGEVKRDNRDYFHSLALRVEAEGYPAVNSRIFVSGGASGPLFYNGSNITPPNAPGPVGDVGNATCNLELNADAVTTGTVVDAQGHPAAGAQVAFVTLMQSYQLPLTGKPRFEKTPFPVPVTDDEGHFRVFVAPNPDFTFAIHEKGFAFLPIRAFATNSTITLKPWCVVDGSAWDYDKPAVGQKITLYGATGQFSARFSAATDDSGHFHFEYVPPVACVLSGGTGPELRCQLQPGENASFKLGGTGRPVRGTVRLQDADQQPAWTGFDMARVAVPQPEGTSVENLQSAFFAGPRYAVQLSPDGSFRIDQLPPGKYVLIFRESGHTMESINRIMNGINDVTGPFEVPAAASPVTREPLDLGVVKLVKVTMARL